MRRWITSADLATVMAPLPDGATALMGRALGRAQGGHEFVFDPFDAYDAALVTNPNVLVAGAIGAGKSTVVKMLVARGLERGRRAVILDPKGEYRELADRFAGEVVTLGVDATSWWSPFTGEERTDLDMVETILATALARALGDDERFVLEIAWLAVSASRSERPLAALHEYFASFLESSIPSPSRTLAYVVRRLVDGDLAGLFDSEAAPMTPTNSLVVVDLSRSWQSESFSLTALAAAAVARRIVDDPRHPSYLVVDEAWAVLSEPRLAHWLHGSWKLARARATSHVLVLHRWSDAYASAGDGTAQRARVTGILRDCDSVVLLRQDPAERALLGEVLRLGELEAAYVLEFARGVGLVRYGRHRSVVRFAPDAGDLAVIDTDQAMRSAR